MAKKPTKAHFLKTIALKYGIIKDIAEAYKVDRRTIYRWRDSDEDFKEAIKNGKDRVIDLAESKFIENINAGKEKTIIFALETIGKNRGYTRLVETRDRSKLEDQFDGLSDDDLEAMLKERMDRLTN